MPRLKMAQLIRPNYKPHKWLLRKKLQIILTNELIPASELDQKNKELSYFDRWLHCSKSIINDFYQKKNSYIKFGKDRGARRYQSKVAIETIFNAAKWLINAKKEALSIRVLATKIVANITNS